MGYPGPTEDDDQYRVPLIAKLLHALPHYNITFHRINNTFRPSDDVYLESLGILGSIPAALLIVSLFGLLLYLLTRCCDRKPRPAHSITSLKVTLSIVTVLCCAAIGLGLYGNDDLHNGLLEVLQAGRKVDGVVSSVRNQTFILENTLTMKIQQQLTELEDIFDQKTNNQTALTQLQQALLTAKGNITIAKNAANDIRRPLVGLTITDFLTKGDQWELIRWPGTVAILALLLVLCAVLLVGVARHSRCALILFSVCGLLAVTGSWLMSGLYLSASVAVGDLCNDPADFLVHQAPHELPADILLYYTQCDISRSNPFTQRLRESQNAINNARNAMSIVSKISPVLFKNAGLAPKLGSVNADIKLCERLLTGLTALVDCRAVHYSYLVATRGLCEGGLLGLVLMLIASFMAAILLTIMVWVDSHTWIYIRKRNDYAQVEEQSYVSHQLHPQSHQNMNTRTLPHHPKGPPVISGSHTIAHPGRNAKHDMSQVQQAQQQMHHQQAHAQAQQAQAQAQAHMMHHHQAMMRAGGTHTLGRLPTRPSKALPPPVSTVAGPDMTTTVDGAAGSDKQIYIYSTAKYGKYDPNGKAHMQQQQQQQQLLHQQHQQHQQHHPAAAAAGGAKMGPEDKGNTGGNKNPNTTTFSSTPGSNSKPLPSIINCPLPDIPKGAGNGGPTSKDDIYVKRKLLSDHPNGSKFATLKPIPAPKIEPNHLSGKQQQQQHQSLSNGANGSDAGTAADLASQLPPPPPPPPPVTGSSSGSSGGSSGYSTSGLTTSQIQSLPLPPPPLELLQQQQQQQQHQHTHQDDQSLLLPPPPTSEELEANGGTQQNGDGHDGEKVGADDNSFYAVTEL
uniref:Protein tweety homolog n=1 Tax=Anopheles dirus TaxID=7168 RepID=A0A182N0N7_9DIPT